ncbi:MAG: hypothetical protein L0Z62_03605 [Gemmataceae bacterium]|nr:hypothetical protein [Gemmataceae bacterium]
MTEDEWLTCDKPLRMSEFLNRPSARKRRLFAVACCRRIEPLLEPFARQAIQTAERYADGLATNEELRQARETVASCDVKDAPDLSAAYRAVTALANRDVDHAFQSAGQHAATAILCRETPVGDPAFPDFLARVRRSPEGDALIGRLARWRCELLRDLFGPLPFRAVRLDLDPLTTEGKAARSMAEHIYAERAFDLLPELGDALEEAGCTDPDILTHCRGGEHVRGCWVVDLILGRT